jgi:hypothetical protein
VDKSWQGGAYGLRIAGLTGARPWMQPQLEGAPTLQLHVRVGEGSDAPSRVDARSADIRLLGGGRLQARRGDGLVGCLLPVRPPDEDLLHPYLAPAAAPLGRWAGREAIHGGAFAARGGAVLLVGGKEAGKSTTLAWLSRAGVTVMSDDLAVLDGGDVLAGPPCDRSPATGGGGGGGAHRPGRRPTSRHTPAGSRRPALAGVAVLEWGPRFEVERVPVDRRMGYLAPQRSFPSLDANGATLLELLSVPTVRFTRPAGLASLARVGRAMMEEFG